MSNLRAKEYKTFEEIKHIENDNEFWYARVHNIAVIISKYSKFLKMQPSEDTLMLFNELTTYYIEGRYPAYKEKLSISLTESETRNILDRSKEAFIWLQEMKP